MKKKKRLKRLMGYSMTMGTGALIGSVMPGTSGIPVTQAVGVGTQFVAPMSVTTGASYVMDSLGNLKPKKRKRRSKK